VNQGGRRAGVVLNQEELVAVPREENGFVSRVDAARRGVVATSTGAHRASQ